MRSAKGLAATASDLAVGNDPFVPGLSPERRRGDLADILAILGARWRMVAAITLAVLGFAMVYLALAPRLYTGSASILIDARSRPPVGDTASANLNAFPDAVLVESQVRLISSDPVLRRVVLAEELESDPEFVPTTPGLRTRLFAIIGLGGQKPAVAEDPVVRALAALAPRVIVKRSERTYIADIEVTSRDPAMAARLANAVARAYFADQQAARNETAARDSEWVLAQVTEMQAGLQAAETRADTYRRDHGIIDVNGKILNEQNLSESATGLVQARAKVVDSKARYDQIERVIASGRHIDSLPDALKSPAIDKLRSQYADISRQQATLRQTLGSRHPALLESDQQLRDVRRLINEELGRIEAGLANEFQTAQANVAMLETQVQGLKATTVSANGDQVKLDELQRDVDARRAVYDRFLRARDTVKEQASDAPIGRLIAPANTPTAASSPKTVAVLALATVTGLLLGLGAALVAQTLSRPPFRGSTERWDTSPDAESVSYDLASTIGVVPSPFGHQGIETRARLIERMRAVWPTVATVPQAIPHADFTAAVAALSIDTTVGRDQAVTTLLLTSEPGDEARTLLALGIADWAAQRGLRAVVIGAEGGRTLLRDMIEPGAEADLLDVMGTTRMCYRAPTPSGETIGLVPKLADEAKVIQRMRGRDGVRQIEGIRGHFDLVIFDGPPVSEIALVNQLSRAAHHMLFVAGPRMNRAKIEAILADVAPAESLAVTVVVAAPIMAFDDASVAA